MNEKKELKYPVLIMIIVLAVIFAALILYGTSKGHSVNAEHFALEQGHMLYNHFEVYKASAVVKFLYRVYDREMLQKELELIFIDTGSEGKETDHEFIKILKSKSDFPVVIDATDKMLKNYNEAVEKIGKEMQIEEFKHELFLRMKGFLVDFNNERIRHNIG